MTNTEKEVLEQLAILRTNQEVSGLHIQYIQKSVKKIEKRLAEKEEKEEFIDKKIAEIDEKIRCVPEAKKDIDFIKADIKNKWKLFCILLGAILGFSVLTISLSQSCSVEKFTTRSSVQTEIQD